MPEMKDSGIKWIGMVPNHWECKKGKYILRYLQKPVRDDDGVITCFRDGEVTLRSNRREDGFTMSDKEIGYQGIDVGDLVVHGMDGFAGAIGISDSRGKASPVLNVLDSDMDKKYVMYYLRSMAYGNVFLALATGIRVRSCDLRWSKLAELPYPVPPLTEQARIADFLDSKCSEIDALTADIQKEIDVLEEYKKSVITEAVTKGLEPDVEMKDSGIEWIGEIPENWKLVKFKFIAEATDIDHYMPEDSDDNKSVPYLMIGDLSDKASKINFTLCKRVSIDDYKKLSKKSKTVYDDIIFARYATIGTVCYVDVTENILVSYACLTIHPKYQVHGKYLFYYLKSGAFLEEVSQYINVNTQGNVGKESLLASKIVLPPICDQDRITDFLDNKCSEIDSIIAEKSEQLTTLEEYKKSVIYEYVTGKKEVTAQ